MDIASIKDFKPLANRVLVKINQRFTDIVQLAPNVDIKIDTSFEPEKHTITYGTVVAVPDTLTYGPLAHHMPWETICEVNIGDKVYFTWDAIITAFGKTNPGVVKVTGSSDIYIIMKYSQLTLKVVDDEIIMLNGYCLIEELKVSDLPKELQDETLKSKILLPKFVERRKSIMFGKVLKTGRENTKYDNDRYSDSVSVQVGDLVVFEIFANVKVQSEIHNDLMGDKILYKIQRRHLIAVINPNNPVG
jgi:co-chaperonin GroES (HSP10)